MTPADFTPGKPAATVRPMGRTVLIAILVSIAGLVCGYVVQGFFQSEPVPLAPIGIPSPQQSGQPVEGWCCAATGDTCVQSDSALVCLRDGGRGFHKTQDGCNKFCAFLSSRP